MSHHGICCSSLPTQCPSFPCPQRQVVPAQDAAQLCPASWGCPLPQARGTVSGQGSLPWGEQRPLPPVADSVAQTLSVSMLWALLVSSVSSQQFGLFTALIYPWKKRPVGDLFISHNHPETSICLRPRTYTKQQWLWKHTNKYWADTKGFSE